MIVATCIIYITNAAIKDRYNISLVNNIEYLL